MVRPEKYARDVAHELEKLNLNNTTVKESPRYRNYSKLSDRYDAKWILDLHSNDSVTNELGSKRSLPYLGMLSCGNRNSEDFCPPLVYKLIDWKKKEYANVPIDIDGSIGNMPQYVISVELLIHNKKSESVKLTKKLIEFLYGQ